MLGQTLVRETTVHQEVSVLIYGRSNVAVVFLFCFVLFFQNDKYKYKNVYSWLSIQCPPCGGFQDNRLKSTVKGVFEEINATE